MWDEIFFDIVLIICLIFILLNTKIKITMIIKEHFKTLRNDITNKISTTDIATFHIVPFIISSVIVLQYKYTISEISLYLTVFSIFAALLFNFLVLIIPLKNKTDITGNRNEIDIKKLKLCISETYFSVCFEILISIVIIVLLLVLDNFLTEITSVTKFICTIVIGLIIKFFLILLMVLKRIFIIFSRIK